MTTPAAPPYRPGDAVRVLLWRNGLSWWRSTVVVGVLPDVTLSGYTWAVSVRNPEYGPGRPPVLTVGSWDNGHGNGLRPG